MLHRHRPTGAAGRRHRIQKELSTSNEFTRMSPAKTKNGLATSIRSRASANVGNNRNDTKQQADQRKSSESSNGKSDRDDEKRENTKSGTFSFRKLKFISVCIIGACALVLAFSLWQRTSGKYTLYGTRQEPIIGPGGWRLDNAAGPELNSSNCNINRVWAEDITTEEFEKMYRYKQPLIIKFQKGAAEWTQPESWSRQSLLEKYSDWDVSSGRSLEIVRRGGSGGKKSSLTSFLDKLMETRDDVDEPLYLFDRKFYKDTLLPETIDPPSFLSVKEELDDSIFFLGASKSGVSFHVHTDAWNGLVFGRKRWFLYPPEFSPPGGIMPGFGALDWLAKVYPNLSPEKKPIECIQEAGEIFYVPESFYHSVINIGDTIAVGIQRRSPSTSLEQLFYRAKDLEAEIQDNDELTKEDIEEMYDEYVKCYEELLERLPENSEVMNSLAIALHSKYEDTEKAIELTKQALKLDPLFIIAYMDLSELYLSMDMQNEAEQQLKTALELNPRMWNIYAKYGDLLSDQNQMAKAAEMYKKGTELRPDMIRFWERLTYTLQKSEQYAEASIARETLHKLETEQKGDQDDY